MLKNYIKIAFRVMLRQKFFTAVIIFGISFTIMFFSIAAGITSLYYGETAPNINRSRIIYFDGFDLQRGEPGKTPTGADFYNTVKKIPHIETLSMYSVGSIESFRDQQRTSFQASFTDAQLWGIYQFEFIEGRPYTQKEAMEGQSLAVITESVKEYYIGSGSATGKYIEDGDQKFKVVGVIKDFGSTGTGVESSSIFVPLNRRIIKQGRQQQSFSAIILAENRSRIAAIKTDLQALIMSRYQVQESDIILKATDIYEGFQRYLTVTCIFLFFIIVIPTLNLVSLNINRISERSSEIGIRKAFGASSGVITTQFIVENILITLLGGVVGIFLTAVFSGLVGNFLTAENGAPFTGNVVNWDVIGASLIASFVFGLLSGVAPARRMSKVHVVAALKNPGS